MQNSNASTDGMTDNVLGDVKRSELEDGYCNLEGKRYRGAASAYGMPMTDDYTAPGKFNGGGFLGRSPGFDR